MLRLHAHLEDAAAEVLQLHLPHAVRLRLERPARSRCAGDERADRLDGDRRRVGVVEAHRDGLAGVAAEGDRQARAQPARVIPRLDAHLRRRVRRDGAATDAGRPARRAGAEVSAVARLRRLADAVAAGLRVAGVADAVTVEVRLRRVRDRRAVVERVDHAVPVRVDGGRARAGGETPARARGGVRAVAGFRRLADAVAAGLRVAGVADAVAVEIRLRRVRDGRAVVEGVDHAVPIRVDGGRALARGETLTWARRGVRALAGLASLAHAVAAGLRVAGVAGAVVIRVRLGRVPGIRAVVERVRDAVAVGVGGRRSRADAARLAEPGTRDVIRAVARLAPLAGAVAARLRIARVPDAVLVGVELPGVRDGRAVVHRIGIAVAVGVARRRAAAVVAAAAGAFGGVGAVTRLRALPYAVAARLRVARVADAVAIGVRLRGVRRVGAVVERIGHAVAVAVGGRGRDDDRARHALRSGGALVLRRAGARLEEGAAVELLVARRPGEGPRAGVGIRIARRRPRHASPGGGRDHLAARAGVGERVAGRN